MNIGVGRTPRSRISRCLLSQKWRHRKGSENRSPLRNHALGRSHRGLRMRCARQHWAFEPTIVLHEKRSRQGGRKRSQESGALANSSCEDHFNLSPQIYSCFTFQPPVPIESTSVQPGALQTRALCARHSLLVLISCRVSAAASSSQLQRRGERLVYPESKRAAGWVENRSEVVGRR